MRQRVWSEICHGRRISARMPIRLETTVLVVFTVLCAFLSGGVVYSDEPPHFVSELTPAASSSASTHPAAVNGILYFAADDGIAGEELWRSDGTLDGTRLVRDIQPEGSSAPRHLTPFNGGLLFTAEDAPGNRELWFMGAAETAEMLLDINPDGGSAPIDIVVASGHAYFSADDGVHGTELWRTDGTPAGTEMVLDIYDQGGSFPRGFTELNGAIYFSATDADHGHELWRTDGTAAGTTMVKDLFPLGSSSPQSLTVANGLLFFAAADSVMGQELWVSDGTSGGTKVVKDIRESGNAFPLFLTPSNTGLYFTADDGVHGRELWKSDGTAAGTLLVKDITDGLFGSFPNSLTTANGILYFTADNVDAGRELWRSDGTDAGTVLVRDIKPGAASSEPIKLIDGNGLLYFVATDPLLGRELWTSNGAEQGTTVVADLNPGANWSDPALFQVVGDNLFFFADGGAGANGLWTYDLPEIDTAPPAITVLGANPMTIEQGTVFTDLGATAVDNFDGDVTPSISATGAVNTSAPGEYVITYAVSDFAGNASEAHRTVNVLPSAPPAIALLGSNPMTVEVLSDYEDAGAIATDNVDGDLTEDLAVSNPVDPAQLGTYFVTYDVSDAAGNAAQQAVRTVHVADQTPPDLAAVGSLNVLLEEGTVYVDPGATATDNFDGDLTDAIVVSNSVDGGAPGDYAVTYDVSDSSGNAAPTVVRAVTVLVNAPPVITLLGDNPLEVQAGAPFVDPGVTALDNVDGDITHRVVSGGKVDTSKLGEYALTYTVSDAAGNSAAPVQRVVRVVDTTPPVITVLGSNPAFVGVSATYQDAGATAHDVFEGDLSASLEIVDNVVNGVPGAYSVSYSASDSSGNEATAIRTVHVKSPSTYYVDAAATGGAGGTQERPFVSIGAAADRTASNTGDTIVVRPGTYAEDVQLKEGVRMKSEAGAYHTFITGSSGNGQATVILANSAALHGFSVTTDSGAAVEISEDAAVRITNNAIYDAATGVYCTNGASVEFVNNTVVNAGDAGLFVEPGASLSALWNNIFTGCASAVRAGSSALPHYGYNHFFDNQNDYDGADYASTDRVANPRFVDADLNFHLTAVSPARNGGHPATAYNDRDGSRNDAGVDGGPGGALDELAPTPVIGTAPDPASGNAPLFVEFDGSNSTDEWGIAAYRWDFDRLDGIGVDAEGPAVSHTFDADGLYNVTLTVLDNNGLSAATTAHVNAGNVPIIRSATATPNAGAVPLNVSFLADATDSGGGPVSYFWDFDGDSVTDDSAPSVGFTYPAGAPLGNVDASVRVRDDNGAESQVFVPVTLTAFPVLASVTTSPWVATELVVDSPNSPLHGTRVVLPAGAATQPFVLTVGTPDPPMDTDFDHELIQIELGPAGAVLSAPATVYVPIAFKVTEIFDVAVMIHSAVSGAWSEIASAGAHMDGDYVVFDVARLGTIAVVEAMPAEREGEGESEPEDEGASEPEAEGDGEGSPDVEGPGGEGTGEVPMEGAGAPEGVGEGADESKGPKRSGCSAAGTTKGGGPAYGDVVIIAVAGMFVAFARRRKKPFYE